jgi:hypothetical protein
MRCSCAPNLREHPWQGALIRNSRWLGHNFGDHSPPIDSDNSSGDCLRRSWHRGNR